MSMGENMKRMATKAAAWLLQWASVVALIVIFMQIDAPVWMYLLLAGTQIGSLRRAWQAARDDIDRTIEGY